MPAVSTPREMASRARDRGIRRKVAATEPVQAPVPGKGMATKAHRPKIFGLWAFVAIPFPGTGAWTGSVAATFLRMPLSRALLAISLGVLTAGIVMGVASYGLLEAIGILL